MNRTLQTLAMLLFAVAATSIARAADVDVRYQLQTSFAGPQTANGRILVSVTNSSGHPLMDVTLRLADASSGRITGPVQEELNLAAGETRKLEGDFVLKIDAIQPGKGLDLRLVYSDAKGFAHQLMVRAEPLVVDPTVMDADQATGQTARP